VQAATPPSDLRACTGGQPMGWITPAGAHPPPMSNFAVRFRTLVRSRGRTPECDQVLHCRPLARNKLCSPSNDHATSPDIHSMGTLTSAQLMTGMAIPQLGSS
jgi:hypothetical protein